MLRQEKQANVALIRERFDRMVSAVLVDYKGLDVAAVTALRDQLRGAGVEYRVVKNSLAKLAIAEHDWAGELDEALIGMTAVAWSYEEPAAAAKVFKEFTKKNKKLQVKLGVVDGKVIDADTVLGTLAAMPGKDELRATFLATLQAPSQQLVAQLSSPAQNFAYLLKARRDQGEAA